MQYKETLTSFREYLVQDGKDEKTTQAYIPIIIKLSQWCTNTTGEELNPEDITALDLKDWVSYLKTNQKLSQATINKHINAARSYYNFLTEEYDQVVNPATKLKSKRPVVTSIFCILFLFFVSQGIITKYFLFYWSPRVFGLFVGLSIGILLFFIFYKYYFKKERKDGINV